MNTILKVCLKRVLRYKDPKITEGYVNPIGEKSPMDIVDVLYAEGRIADKDLAMQIISSYNAKAAELTMSGYIVRTGLVKLMAGMKGLVYDKKWSRFGNRIDVQFEVDDVLIEAAQNTNVEFDLTSIESEEEQEKIDDVFSDELNLQTFRLGSSRILTEGEPACGIAFRQWLCKSV